MAVFMDKEHLILRILIRQTQILSSTLENGRQIYFSAKEKYSTRMERSM